jgi:hypothetical protein
MGALYDLGNPVVSVSKIKYMGIQRISTQIRANNGKQKMERRKLSQRFLELENLKK